MMPRTLQPLTTGAALVLALSSCASGGGVGAPLVSAPARDNLTLSTSRSNATAATRIFVGETLGGVLEFAGSDNGDVAPLATIGGTGTSAPRGITANNGRLYVISSPTSRRANPSLAVFPSTTDGNPPPLNIATCRGMHLSDDVDIDPSGAAYVTNTGDQFVSGSIAIFPSNANGCVKTSTLISGPHTLLNRPAGIRIGSLGAIYVTDAKSNAITVFAPHSVGDVSPRRIIQGANTNLNLPTAIALDSTEAIYVANGDGQSVTVYAPNASGNAAPSRTIQGKKTGLSSPVGIAVDGVGQIYVSNAGATYGAVTIYSATANGNAPPIRTIGGPSHAKTYYQSGIAVQ